ncbi:MAG: transposase, partial [Pseudomonadota bacterium]
MSKKYTEEFKRECVSYLETHEVSIQKAADSLGVSDSALREWRKKYRNFEDSGLSKTEKEELLLLRKEVKKLKAEKDILKKA